MFKKFLLIFLAVLTLSIPTMTAFAADITDTGGEGMTSSIAFSCNVSAYQMRITHPVSVAYVMNPNTNAIVAAPINLTNTNQAPVKVKVLSFKSTSGGTIQFTDVMPADKTWASLNKADSKTFIALGIGASGTGWTGSTDSGYTAPHMYAAQSDTIAAAGGYAVGQIDYNKTGVLAIDGYFGRAIDTGYTAQHSLVLEFDLA